MTDAEDLKQRINQLGNDKNSQEYTAAIERLEQKIEEYVRQVEDRCSNIDNAVATLQEDMNDTVDKKLLEEKLAQVVKDTQQQVRTELADELNQVEAVDRRLNHVEKLMETIENKVAATHDELASRISALEDSVSTTANNVSQIESSMNDVNSRVRQLSRTMEGVQADVNGQEQRLTRLETAEQSWEDVFAKVDAQITRDNAFGITRDKGGQLRTKEGTYIDDMGDLVEEILRSVETLEKEQMRLRQQLSEDSDMAEDSK